MTDPLRKTVREFNPKTHRYTPAQAEEVRDGEVTVCADEFDPHEGTEPEKIDHTLSFIASMTSYRPRDGSRGHENGIKDEWIEEWGEKSRPILDKIREEDQ